MNIGLYTFALGFYYKYFIAEIHKKKYTEISSDCFGLNMFSSSGW